MFAATVDGVLSVVVVLAGAVAAGYALSPVSSSMAESVALWAASVASSLLARFDLSEDLAQLGSLVAAVIAPGLLTLVAVAASRLTAAARTAAVAAVVVVAVLGLFSDAFAVSLALMGLVLVVLLVALFAARLASLGALFVAGFVSTGWLVLLWTSDRFAQQVWELSGSGELLWWRVVALVAATVPLAIAAGMVFSPRAVTK